MSCRALGLGFRVHRGSGLTIVPNMHHAYVLLLGSNSFIVGVCLFFKIVAWLSVPSVLQPRKLPELKGDCNLDKTPHHTWFANCQDYFAF